MHQISPKCSLFSENKNLILCFSCKDCMKRNAFKWGWAFCYGVEVRDFPRNAAVSVAATMLLLAEMKSCVQRKFQLHDRIPRTRVISPNWLMGPSYNATAFRIRYLVSREIYGKISFYSLWTLCPDKDRYCNLLGISPRFSGLSLFLFPYNHGFYSITCMRHVETDVQMASRVKAPHLHTRTFFKRHFVAQFWSNNHSRGRRGRLPSCFIAVHFSS